MTEKSKAIATGRTVFIALAVLTVIEFVVAVSVNLAPLVFVIALAKAWLIVVYFMHIGEVRRGSH